MRRFKPLLIPFLAAFAILAGVAFGDEMQVDVTDFGAKGDGQSDNTAAFARAIEAAASKLAGRTDSRAVVKVPGASRPYLINRPINLNVSDVCIVGDGPQSRIQNIGYGPVLVVGMRDTEPSRRPGVPVALRPESRPSRLSRLDGSFGGSAVRTMGDSTIVFSGSPFDLGPPNRDYGLSNWSVDTLVIDMVIERNADGGQWPAGKVEGIAMLGGYGSKPVFRVQKGGGSNTVDLILTDTAGNVGTASVQVGPKPIKRVSIQVDLAGRTVAAWSDRIRVPVSLGGTAFGRGGSGRLSANRRDAMILGATPQTADGRPPLASEGAEIPDWTYWGFSLSSHQKYRVGAMGDPQQSASGQSVNDAFAVGMGDGGRCVASLYGQSDHRPGDRYVDALTGTNGFRVFYGFQVQKDQYQIMGGQQRNGIKGLQLAGVSKSLCPTVQLFSVLHFSAEDCLMRDGTQAIGVVPSLASYPIKIRNCRMEGLDSCVSAAWSTVDLIDCEFDRIGRTGINAWASDITVDRLKCWFISPNSEHLIANRGGLYGGHTVISNLVADFEEYPLALSPFLVTQTDRLMTVLSVTDAYLAISAKGKPLVIADWPDGIPEPITIDLARIDTAGHPPSVLIQSDKPLPRPSRTGD